MELDYLFNLSNTEQTLLLIAVTALVLAVIAFFSGTAARRKLAAQNSGVKKRVDVLWADMNELRVPEVNDPFSTPDYTSDRNPASKPDNSPGYSSAVEATSTNTSNIASKNDGTSAERFSAEKAAYEAVWPMVWALHDKLGMFLRAVEADEQPGELRVEARNAALDARKTLSRVRPFCNADIDELITQVIDNHIKAHLAACHLMDLRKGSLANSSDHASSDHANSDHANSDHERAVQKEKFRILYDGQAKEMLDQLVTLIRQRILG